MRWLLLLLVIACGCGQTSEKSRKEIVRLEDVPPAVVKAARDKLPGVQFDSALRMPNGVYEIRGKGKNGKIQEVEVSESGEVLAVE